MKNKEPDQNINMLLAVGLSMAVLFVWTTFFMPKPPKPAPKNSTEISEQAGSNGISANGQPGRSIQPGGNDARAADLEKKAGRVAVDTVALSGSVSLLGGRIDDLVLKRYKETLADDSPAVSLLHKANTQKAYFVEHGWVAGNGTNIKVPNHTTIWSSDKTATLTTATPITLTWDNGEGITFKRTISVDDNYMFKVVETVENKTANAVTLYPYARVYRYGTPKIEGFFIQHEGPIGVLGKEDLQEIDYADLLEPGGNVRFDDVRGGWLGFTDKYWAVAVIPDQAVSYNANITLAGKRSRTTKEAYQADYLVAPITITAGQSGAVTSHVFAGAKQANLIDEYNDTLNIEKFELIIDWGWFYFITKPLYQLMAWLYNIFGNFGLSILATTVLVKVLFFWPASKGYESMAKMKKLQPDMERIRERFKDEPQRQQKAMMELYKTEKINPLAGCWPILLQIPVFFALYKVVFISLDMRHAPFYGWIQDLSAPDPTSIFNLFGLLPYGVPDFLLIGVWPVLMGITMWLQMQLNPPQPDPTQQMIFNWMPVFFTFLLGTFASGLVIYWTWNNILSLAQQYAIMKRQGADIHLFDNIKKAFGVVGKLIGRGRDKDGAKS